MYFSNSYRIYAHPTNADYARDGWQRKSYKEICNQMTITTTMKAFFPKLKRGMHVSVNGSLGNDGIWTVKSIDSAHTFTLRRFTTLRHLNWKQPWKWLWQNIVGTPLDYQLIARWS